MSTDGKTADGLRCPSCGASYVRQRVTDSRGRRAGGVRRRRECESCGSRYTTVETIIDAADLRSVGPWVEQHRERMRALLGDVTAIQETLAWELAAWPFPSEENVPS